MIIPDKNSYIGLHEFDVYLLDTSRTSPEYLKLDSFPTELTSGRNLFKLSGNINAFKDNFPIYIEILDSAGNVVFTDFTEYYDSLKRRVVVVVVDENTAPGEALVTICSTLHDDLVPEEYRDVINFKWQTTINISPFSTNYTEIIYDSPPEIELTTLVKPYVTASYRNGMEMISYEYGDYSFYDYQYGDHVGSNDNSRSIHQKQKASNILNSVVSPSLTSFDRDNVFYLRDVNFSARHIVKNLPILNPGTSFYSAVSNNIILDPGFEKTTADTDTNYWYLTGSALPLGTPIANYLHGWSLTTATGADNVITANVTAPNSASFAAYIPNLLPGHSYLVITDVSASNTTIALDVSLGYDDTINSGSISLDVTNNITTLSAASQWVQVPLLLKASDAGNYLWFKATNFNGKLNNIRVFPIKTLSSLDFTLNSDLIGGFVKIKNPAIFPATASGYSILSGDPAYISYIDTIFQKYNSGVDDRFQYSLVKTDTLTSPSTYNILQHPINGFSSNITPGYVLINANPILTYQYETSANLTPTVSTPGSMILFNGELYGTFYTGGQTPSSGCIFKYNVESKIFTILFNFYPRIGKKPVRTFLPLISQTTGRTIFYGIAQEGGYYGSGSLYSFDPNNNNFSLLYNFGHSGSILRQVNPVGGVDPSGKLMQASNGLIYGTTKHGGSLDSGVIYSFNTASNIYNYLADIPGHYLSSGLLEVAGKLWGQSAFGGTNGSGSIFTFDTGSNVVTVVHSFSGNDGRFPDREFLLAEDGLLYATTFDSDTSTTGSVLYSMDPNTNTFTPLVYFDSATSGSTGTYPLLESEGKIFGVLETGGTFNSGSVFAYDTGSNSVTIIHAFSGSATIADGAAPKGNFVRIGNSLYSTTNQGVYGGTIYSIVLSGISAPYVEEEAGLIYHNNSILPTRLPAIASLIQDYPRWTGPVGLGETGLYAIVELKMKHLTPLSGDISKIKIGAKPKGNKGEFIDLGVYSTTPSDILMDPEYVNHVQYAASPYRLTGYFKPTITDHQISLAEDPTLRDTLFLQGWQTGSITNSYFTLPNFHTTLEVTDFAPNAMPLGSVLRCKVTESLAGNGLAYAIFTSSILPPITSSLNTWQQISYELLAAYPLLTSMDTASANYYTGSSALDILGLNNILVYSALFRKTASLTENDIYQISPALSNHAYNITGSTISQSAGDHPFIFHNKLGWKTDDYLIDIETAASGSVWMGLLFEYNSGSINTLGTTISDTNPHLVDVANVLSREIGDREYMINKYWEWSARAKYPLTTLMCSASVTSNTDRLMDSALIQATNDAYFGAEQRNKLVFQTRDAQEYLEGVPYILSFNACSKLDYIYKSGSEVIDSTFLQSFDGPWTVSPLPSWGRSGGNWASFDFTSNLSGSLIPPTSSTSIPSANTFINATGQYTYGTGKYLVTIITGMFTYSTMDNPTSLFIEWPAGAIYEIPNLQPFSTASINIIITETTDIPKFTIKAQKTVAAKAYIQSLSIIPIQIAYDAESYVGFETNIDPGFDGNPDWTYTTAGPGPAPYISNGEAVFPSFGGYPWPYIHDSVNIIPLASAGPQVIKYYIETGAWPSTIVDGVSGASNRIEVFLIGGSTINVVRIDNPSPNTTYSGEIFATVADGQYFRIDGRVNTSPGQNDGTPHTVKTARVTLSPMYTFISETNPILLPQTTLTAYGVNVSPGVPFRDQLTTAEIGEFIGELVHKNEYGTSGETKTYRHVEMEFEAESSGLGKIAFETDAGSQWCLSEISVRPKDRVGITPGYSKIFIRIPSDLINTPLSFKVEYLNDSNEKAPYVTMLNDVIFTNNAEQITKNKSSLNSGTVIPIATTEGNL